MHVDLIVLAVQLAFDAWVCFVMLTYETRISEDLKDGYTECRQYTQRVKDEHFALITDLGEATERLLGAMQAQSTLNELHEKALESCGLAIPRLAHGQKPKEFLSCAPKEPSSATLDCSPNSTQT